jgi:ABC-type amino acid transport system permease subunit
MTTEGTATLPAAEPAADDDGTLHCYRHPDRETWVRCGRCDRPICTKCAMQGPVGFRCRDCGKPVNDPLTSMKPHQVALGSLVSIGASVLGGLIGLQLGFLAIFVGFFAGGLTADLVMRVTGYKRGPVMATILLGGIALTLSYTAYVAEVYRAGIESVHRSQRQAALAVGLTERQSMRFVILPQAVRRVVPPLLNDFIALQKDVALVSILGPLEAFRVGQIEAASNFIYTPLVAAGVLYLCVTIPCTRYLDHVQRRQRTA